MALARVSARQRKMPLFQAKLPVARNSSARARSGFSVKRDDLAQDRQAAPGALPDGRALLDVAVAGLRAGGRNAQNDDCLAPLAATSTPAWRTSTEALGDRSRRGLMGRSRGRWLGRYLEQKGRESAGRERCCGPWAQRGCDSRATSGSCSGDLRGEQTVGDDPEVVRSGEGLQPESVSWIMVRSPSRASTCLARAGCCAARSGCRCLRPG